MKKSEECGFGDLLLDAGAMLILLRWTGVISVPWQAICNFNLFVLIYLSFCLLIRLLIYVKRGK